MTTARLNQGTPLLLEGVTKRYGAKTILNALDLHIPAGQFVAVVGRSGGGKSTLLRLLAGLETPNGGALRAGNAPLSDAQDDTRMMFQDARLLPWKTVLDKRRAGAEGQLATRGASGAGRSGTCRSHRRLARRAVGRPEAARGAGARLNPSPRPAAA